MSFRFSWIPQSRNRVECRCVILPSSNSRSPVFVNALPDKQIRAVSWPPAEKETAGIEEFR